MIELSEIGPKNSNTDSRDPNGASGGRINGLAIDRNNNRVIYAASEWGGLFNSKDMGRKWKHLDGHVPTATWDIVVDPINSNRVYATSFYDGKIDSLAGINISNDAGVTWHRPKSSIPNSDFCSSKIQANEQSAFGIAIDPDNPKNVYVGTNCGLAITRDHGKTWIYVDPSPSDKPDKIWDVIVHHGGIIDICGQDGHYRSIDKGANWTTATGANPLPGGRCSITSSPTEPYVLFSVVGTTIFESNDGGKSWPIRYVNPSKQGRIPFVKTNLRKGNKFDLWFGDISLHRASCTTPNNPKPGGVQRCQPSNFWAGGFTSRSGGHDDVGTIIFDAGTQIDSCPVLYSSDGGVYFNTVSSTPECHSPKWEQPFITPQAVWNFDMEGVNKHGKKEEDLYFGNQDTGIFGSKNAGSENPDWNNEQCCDGFDVAADESTVLSTVCCFRGGRRTRLFIGDPGMTNMNEINQYPDGSLLRFQQLDSIINFGTDKYAIVTTKGVYVTHDIRANPIKWTQIGSFPIQFQACGIQSSKSNNNVHFFIKSRGCNGQRPGTLWRYDGDQPNGKWIQITRNLGGKFTLFAVDPNDPNTIIAADEDDAGNFGMVMTNNGGRTWNKLPKLDSLMTGGGKFKYRTTIGPTRFTGFNGYYQPTLVAFNPKDSNIIVAAGSDSGVFLSLNKGKDWKLITDPYTPGLSDIPHIPRARYAHFDHDSDGIVNLYLGTQGRGQWRIRFTK